MKSYFATIVFSLAVGCMSLLAFPIVSLFAEADSGVRLAQIEKIDNAGKFGLTEGQSVKDVGNIIKGILNAFLTLVGIVALIFVLYGGFQYITSRGDEGQAESAKKTIIYAVVGLVIVGLSAVIVNFVINAVGGNRGSFLELHQQQVVTSEEVGVYEQIA